MMKVLSIRERQYKKIHNEYYNDFQNLKEYLMEGHQGESKITDKYLSLEDIYRFQHDSLSDKDSVNNKVEENKSKE